MKYISVFMSLIFFVNTSFANGPEVNEVYESIDSLITRAEIEDERLEDSVARLSEKMEKNFHKNSKKIERVLAKYSTDESLKKYLKRKAQGPLHSKKINPEEFSSRIDSMTDLREEILKATDYEKFQEGKEQFLNKVRESGSLVRFYKNIKTETLAKGKSLEGRGETTYDFATFESSLLMDVIAIILALAFWSGVGVLLGLSLATMGIIWLVMAGVIVLTGIIFTFIGEVIPSSGDLKRKSMCFNYVNPLIVQMA